METLFLPRHQESQTRPGLMGTINLLHHLWEIVVVDDRPRGSRCFFTHAAGDVSQRNFIWIVLRAQAKWQHNRQQDKATNLLQDAAISHEIRSDTLRHCRRKSVNSLYGGPEGTKQRQQTLVTVTSGGSLRKRRARVDEMEAQRVRAPELVSLFLQQAL
jgi:hypothetical protein